MGTRIHRTSPPTAGASSSRPHRPPSQRLTSVLSSAHPGDAPATTKKKAKSNQTAADLDERAIRRGATSSAAATSSAYADILEASQDLEGVSYRPRTSETREVFELVLGQVHRLLGDQAADVVRSATDTVIEILKAEDLKEFDKKAEVEDIVGRVSADVFGTLLNLSKKLTDYGDGAAEADGVAKRDDFGEEGVAVEFEGEDDEEDEDGLEGEVKDESASEDEEDDEAEDAEMQPADEDDEDADITLGDAAPRKKAKSAKAAAGDEIAVHDIDAFFLQRLVAKSYPDPVETTRLTNAALETLSSDFNLRDVENGLMELFDYANFDLVRVLTKNRDKIVWCTKLARASDDERVDLEVAMRERGVAWILRELAGGRSGAKAADGDAMEVDTDDVVKQAAKPKATIAPGALGLQPRKTVDINAMIFSEGAHLNSNRKPITLPKGSKKTSHKGYDQILVQAPKKVEIGDKDLVNIADLPEWTRPAFGTESSKLNPIQSKAYPIAFGTDEPILLCAPTGAGKVRLGPLFRLFAASSLTSFSAPLCRPTSPS
jgi:pre-mRNA-splicing helicase BRR2